MRLSTTLFLAGVVSFALMGVGVALSVYQQSQLASAQTAAGRVIESKHVGRGVWIAYEYQVSGETFKSDRLTVLPMRINATDVLERYPKGAAVSVYVDSTKPSRAFLIFQSAAYPHLLVFAGGAVVLLTWRLLRLTGALMPKPQPSQTLRSGWYVLPRTASPMEAVGARCFEALLWLVLVVGCVWHYFAVAPPAYDWMILIATLGLLGVVIPLIEAWRWMGLGAALGEPRISVLQDHLQLDQSVIVRLRLPVWHDLDVREIRAVLVSEQRSGLGRQNLYANSTVVAANETLRPQQPLEGEYAFDVPPKKRRVSKRFERFAASRVDWCVELHIKPIHGRKFMMRFPVQAVTDVKQPQASAAA